MSEAQNPNSSGDPVIPDKLYFRIGEVARLLEVETHTLRFWETEFPQLRVGKGGTGQRLYRRRDVELVLEIKHLLYKQGYTIPGARQHLQTRGRTKDNASTAAAAAPENVPAERNPAGTPNLRRLRAELRDLSAMLADKAAENTPARPTASQSPPKTGAEKDPPRRGLHLASKPAAKPAPQTTHPGLFDPRAD